MHKLTRRLLRARDARAAWSAHSRLSLREDFGASRWLVLITDSTLPGIAGSPTSTLRLVPRGAAELRIFETFFESARPRSGRSATRSASTCSAATAARSGRAALIPLGRARLDRTARDRQSRYRALPADHEHGFPRADRRARQRGAARRRRRMSVRRSRGGVDRFSRACATSGGSPHTRTQLRARSRRRWSSSATTQAHRRLAIARCAARPRSFAARCHRRGLSRRVDPAPALGRAQFLPSSCCARAELRHNPRRGRSGAEARAKRLPRDAAMPTRWRVCSSSAADERLGVRDQAIMELFYSSGLRLCRAARARSPRHRPA